MKEEIQKLIKKYESRIAFLKTIIDEISALPMPTKEEISHLESAEYSQILWKEVLKDLKKIVDKRT